MEQSKIIDTLETYHCSLLLRPRLGRTRVADTPEEAGFLGAPQGESYSHRE